MLHATEPRLLMAGLLVEDLWGWPEHHVTIGTEGDLVFFIVPQGAGRARLYLLWSCGERRRFAGPGGREPFSTALPGWSRIGARSRASLPNSPGFARTMRCADRCTLLLHPDVVTEALRRFTEPDPTTEPPEQQRARLQRDLAQVERELAHFTEAIAAGGSTMESVLKAIKLREQQRDEVQHALSRLDLQTVAPIGVSALRPRITALLADMRGPAGRHVRATRQLLRKLLVERLTFSPDVAQAGVIRFRGEGTLAPIIGRFELHGVQGLVAPTGYPRRWIWADSRWPGRRRRSGLASACASS